MKRPYIEGDRVAKSRVARAVHGVFRGLATHSPHGLLIRDCFRISNPCVFYNGLVHLQTSVLIFKDLGPPSNPHFFSGLGLFASNPLPFGRGLEKGGAQASLSL